MLRFRSFLFLPRVGLSHVIICSYLVILREKEFNQTILSQYSTHCSYAGPLYPGCVSELISVQRCYHDLLTKPEVSHLYPETVSYWWFLPHALLAFWFANADFLRVSEVSSKRHPSVISGKPRWLVVLGRIVCASFNLRQRKDHCFACLYINLEPCHFR